MDTRKEIHRRVDEFLDNHEAFGTLTIRKGENGKIKRVTVNYDQDWHFEEIILGHTKPIDGNANELYNSGITK